MQENFLKNAVYLWSEKKRVFYGAVPFLIFGLVLALLKAPTYTVQISIFPKESGMGRGGSGISIGGLSLNPFQNTQLDKMDFMLQSEELAEAVVRKNNLLPALYPKKWDAGRKAWKRGRPPAAREGAQLIMKRMITDPGKGFLIAGVTTKDSALSLRVLSGYLNALNAKLREDARVDMVRNVAFLQEQLTQTEDPMLRDKLQQLIASQLETFMYQGASAFDVVGDLRPPLKADPSRRVALVILSFLAGLFFSGLARILLRDKQEWRRAWARARADHP
jgi:uncharacterized protein involved in exopolysaccharide biosynthesis